MLPQAHPKLLERRPWREGIYEGARKKDGTYGQVHLSASQEARASGGVAERAMWQRLADMAKVPEGVIGSKSHRALADKAFGAALSESQQKAIERMLRHRDGWLFEDLYAFDLDRGTVIGSVTDQRRRQAVSFTVKLRKAVKQRVDAGGAVAIVHNHPHSSMPSFADVKSLLDSKAKTGVIACHDGSFYAFSKVSEPAPGYNVTEEDFKLAGFASANEEKVLEHIERNLGIRIEHFR